MPLTQRMSMRAGRGADGERGSALILVTASLTMLMAFAIVAIDTPILLTTKGQLQKAADAAALAGASGLLENSPDLAVRRAIEFAGYNNAMEDALTPVVITAADVTFPETGVIRVETHRTTDTGDPLRTYFRRLVMPFQPNTVDVTAVASAWAGDLCGSKCLKPWAVPDRWDDANGNGIYDPGEYYAAGVTSYMAPGDVGQTITLKVGNPQQAIAPGQFFPVALPPIGQAQSPLTGGNWYRTWISECEPYTVEPGDRLLLEPGNMVGPTTQGVRDLIAQDPAAQWSPGLKTVTGSRFGLSPRIALVPFFDPTQPPTPGRNSVQVTRVGVVFIERVTSNDVIGRFMTINTSGIPCSPGNPGVPGTFLKGITLIL